MHEASWSEHGGSTNQVHAQDTEAVRTKAGGTASTVTSCEAPEGHGSSNNTKVYQ